MSSLSAAHEAAAIVLAGGGTVEEAAAAAHRTERTIVRWRTDPAFRRLVADMRSAALEEAQSILAGRLRELVERLLMFALDPGPQTPAERLRAIVSALRFAGEWRDADIWHDITEIKERLEEAGL